MFKKAIAATLVAAAGAMAAPQSGACTRVVYTGTNNLYVVGRSLDWKTPIPTNIYVYPRGLKKVGHSRENPVKWTSRYGAVYAVSYDAGVTEGMNEAGLSVNGLFCKGTVYENEGTKSRPAISLAMFPAWILDQCATTDEVVRLLESQPFNISGSSFDNGTETALHWGITDATGSTIVLEFDQGQLNIYGGEPMPVLTNDPNWPQMQAINEYWKKIGGVNMLPGTVKSPDRFVRASFFVDNVEKTPNADLGVAICRSILVNCCVPYTYTVQGEGNVSSTQWRSYSNLRDRRYYFDIVTNLGVFYIDLAQCNLKPGAKIRRLNTAQSQGYIGDVTKKLDVHPGFTPQH